MIRIPLILLLTIGLLSIPEIRGEWRPSFDLDSCVGGSQLIVHGWLDEAGSLRVVNALKGDVQADIKIPVASGSFHFNTFQRSPQISKATGTTKKADAFEVVAFLKEQSRNEWRLTLGSAGLVAMTGDAVYYFQGAFGGFSENRHVIGESFLDEVRTAILLAQERQKLLETPRSRERARALVALVVRHGRETPPSESFPFEQPRYNVSQIADGLRPPSVEEGSVILEALQTATDPGDQTVLLELVGDIRWNGAFDTTAKFLDSSYSPTVRREAIRALGQIDQYRAIDHLAPLLTLDEPELLVVLSNLGPNSFPPQDRLLNIKAVDSLAKLARVMTSRHREEGRHVLGNESYALVGQMEHYFHPHLAGLFYELALKDDHVSSEQALVNLRSATGLKLNRNDADAWQSWWTTAQPLLGKEYDLHTKEGRSVWMAAWKTADEATRSILMRLWFFEPEIDESAIFEEAKQSEVARIVLAELWQRKRLSPETRKAIVEHFLHFRLLEENVHTPKYPTARSWGYIAETNFPFPADSWVSIRSDMSHTEREPKIQEDDSSGEQSLQTVASGGFRCGGSGSEAGRPLLRAVIELSEKDYQSGGKIVWTLRWTPDPLMLQNLTK